MPSMKKAVSIFLLAACAAHAEPQTEAVACLGRVVPGDRIAKLTAVSPTGGQPVIKKLFVKKGDFVEEGAPVAEMEGIDKARASLKRAEAVLSAAKSASDIRLQQQRHGAHPSSLVHGFREMQHQAKTQTRNKSRRHTALTSGYGNLFAEIFSQVVCVDEERRYLEQHHCCARQRPLGR